MIDDNKEHDESFFEAVTKEFFNETLSCLKFLQETFKDPAQGNSCMSSFSTWVNTEIQNLYAMIAPYLYETDDLPLASIQSLLLKFLIPCSLLFKKDLYDFYGKTK